MGLRAISWPRKLQSWLGNLDGLAPESGCSTIALILPCVSLYLVVSSLNCKSLGVGTLRSHSL